MVDTFGVFEKDYLGSSYASFLNERLAQNQLNAIRSPLAQAQAIMLGEGFGFNQAQLQNTWNKNADPDYESALRELNAEFPGLRE